MFADEASLKAVYPSLVNHAVQQFGCRDVMRFLGRRFHRDFNGEVTSNVKHRPEGVRVKHWVEENSIKMYDKQGSVLRIETTINNPRRFNVRRKATRHGQLVTAWFPMRKSVADTARRVEISRAANERYLEALGVVGEPSSTRQMLDPVSKRIVRKGRSYRALRPIEPEEAKLFSILLDGTFLLQGFRNRHIRRRLYPGSERNPRTVDKSSRPCYPPVATPPRPRTHPKGLQDVLLSRYRPAEIRIMATALRLRQIPALALAP